jgi:hypothetical protein
MHHLKKLLPQKGSKQKKREGAQTTSSSPAVGPVPHACGSANPSIARLSAPPNLADRAPSAPPIGCAEQVGIEYEPSHPNPWTSTNERPPSPQQDVDDDASLYSNFGVATALSHNSFSAPDYPLHRLLSLTPTTTTLQGVRQNKYCIPHVLTFLPAPSRYHFHV